MTADPFTRELVQTVSDWQRGGSHDQKVKRGKCLKAVAATLRRGALDECEGHSSSLGQFIVRRPVLPACCVVDASRISQVAW